MTLSITASYCTYTGDGVTQAFDVKSGSDGIYFETASELAVTLRSGDTITPQTISTHYTVSGAGSAAGSIEFLTAPADGVEIRIERNTARTQSLSLSQAGAFSPPAIMSAFDKLTRITQDLSRGTGSGSGSGTYDSVPLTLDASGDEWDAGSKPLGNLDPATESDQAVTLGQIETAIEDAAAAATAAAATSATEAANSASSAATSATTATTQAGNAATSAATASTAATDAATSASDAADSASDAAASALAAAAASTGDVSGPASAVADHVATFNLTTGKLIKDGGKTISEIEAAAASAALTAVRDGVSAAYDTLAEVSTALGTKLNSSAVSAFGLTLIDDADAATARTTLAIAGKATVGMPAGAMTPRTTNGAASGTTELTTNKTMLSTLDFDTTTKEYAGFWVCFPKSYNNGTVSFEAAWTAASGSGGVAWGLAAYAFSDDDAMDTAVSGQQVVTDTLITANDLHRTAESSAITIGGTPAAGDWVYFEITREVANGSDTLAVDAKLLGIRLFFTENATNDS